VGFLETTVPNKVVPDCDPIVDAEVLDGAAIVYMLPPIGVIFMPYIRRRLQNVNRLDIAWDRYTKNSLKQITRESRGTGQRRRVMATTPLPRNRRSFIQVDSNKNELFHSLVDYIGKEITPDGKKLVATYGHQCEVHACQQGHSLYIEPCTHEKADTLIMILVADCSGQGYRKVNIRTVDTDVVTLAVSVVNELEISEL